MPARDALPWSDGGLGPAVRARRLAQVYDNYLGGGAARPRPLVGASWQRALAAGIDPDGSSPPLVLELEEVVGLRGGHPLAPVIPLLRATLLSASAEGRYVVVVTDSDGTVLWVEGDRNTRRMAERQQLVPGACWSETVAGTNAMGTALAVDRPVQIHSAEHLVRHYHRWSCAAAPVHDPSTGAVLGVIDVTGPYETIHPGTVAVVTATARLAETELRQRRARAAVVPARPAGTPPVAGTFGERLGLAFLTGARPSAVLPGRSLTLSPRHAELLALLALHPDGLTGDQLAAHLYLDRGNPVTVRAEMHRLRRALGPCLLARPYRFGGPLDADFLAVREFIYRGDVGRALRLYRHPLLPLSEAPAIRTARDELAGLVHRVAADCDDAEALLPWLGTDEGRTHLGAHRRTLALLPAGDPRRAVVAEGVARLERLDEREWQATRGAGIRATPGGWPAGYGG
jgi:hypothetical protein